MRNGQNKRMRGRNRKGQNPLTRVYESNGPDVKIRGTASHVAEKYIQLARDAQGSGDPVAAENYYQHAEHYFRLIAAAQEQFRQSQPSQPYFRPESEPREESFEDGEEDHGTDSPFGREPQQPYPPRDAQPYPRDQHYGGRGPQHQPYPPRDQQAYGGRQPGPAPEQGDGDRLPSFITGTGPQPSYPSHGANGFDGQPDRFPLHRRRRRRHGHRGDMPGSSQHGGGPAEEAGPPPAPGGGGTSNE
jgi:hypothetical protein